MNLIQSIQNQTMSTLDIAKLTGKRHDHVMRDAQKMMEQLNIHAPQFWGSYKTKQGNEYGLFNLPKRETLILVSGYNIELRAKIIIAGNFLSANFLKNTTMNYCEKHPSSNTNR